MNRLRWTPLHSSNQSITPSVPFENQLLNIHIYLPEGGSWIRSKEKKRARNTILPSQRFGALTIYVKTGSCSTPLKKGLCEYTQSSWFSFAGIRRAEENNLWVHLEWFFLIHLWSCQTSSIVWRGSTKTHNAPIAYEDMAKAEWKYIYQENSFII